MQNQNFQTIKQDAANNSAPKPFYVKTTAFGSNAAATDIIRVPARNSAAR